MRIVILADSTALARAKSAGNIPYENTYPYLLEQSMKERFGADGPTFIERGMRSRTIEDVVKDWYDEVELKNADIVIVHVGGNDAAPRVFLPHEREFLETIPFGWLRNQIFLWEKKYKRHLIRLIPNRVNVPLRRFRQKVAETIERASHSKLTRLILVNIVPINHRLEYLCPGIGKNTELYNRVLAEQASHPKVTVVNVRDLVPRHGGINRVILEDGMHLTRYGHQAIASELEAEILKVMEKERGEDRPLRISRGGK